MIWMSLPSVRLICHSVAEPFSVQLRSAVCLLTLVAVRPEGIGQVGVVNSTVLLQLLKPSVPQLPITCTS